jgi:hypothetical protein
MLQKLSRKLPPKSTQSLERYKRREQRVYYPHAAAASRKYTRKRNAILLSLLEISKQVL